MTSLWTATFERRPFDSLSGEVSVDVAVIGGGIFGLTTAWLLKEAGKSVAVLEAREIGVGVTGSSTGKLTSQHGAMYHDLTKRFSKNIARAYGEANQWAIEEVARIVAGNGIDCDFERREACLVAQGAAGAAQIEREAAAAEALGLPARRADSLPTPQPLRDALVFADQAQIHPSRYLQGLAAVVTGDGSHVFENCRATGVGGGSPQRVTTNTGVVSAQEVVIATHLPFLDRAGFFARAYPRAHVGIAAPLPAEAAPQAMYICVDGAPHSYRSWHDGSQAYLVAISEGFTPGHLDDINAVAVKLEEEVRQLWPVREVTHRWTAEDYHAADNRPYAGRLPFGGKGLYTATGFGAWGLTNGTAAARVVADSILHRQPDWPGLYDTRRLASSVTPRFLRRNLHVAQHWVDGRLARGARRSLSDLARGEGAILQTEEGKLAVYRDAAGSFHAFSPYCPHMQCLLGWNNLERTWDCACHGSRFAADGGLLHGPAVSDLAPKPLP